MRLLKRVNSLKSIRARNPERWEVLRAVSGVVFVGSSCSGKSTLIDAIRRTPTLKAAGIRIPVRYVTRPPRHADNFIENRHITREEFDKMVCRGEIGASWVRKMEGGREEQYGFETVPTGCLAVYSANNGVYNNPDSVKPHDAFDDALFVGVFAPDSVRLARMVRRSPDLVKQRAEEVNYRLDDRAANVLPHVHLLIRNYGAFEEIAETEVIALLTALADARSAEVVKI